MTHEDFLTEENRKLIEQVYEAVTKSPVNVEFNEDDTDFHLDNGLNIYPKVKMEEEETLNGREPVERLVWIVDAEVMNGGSYWEPADYDFIVIARDLSTIYDAIYTIICEEVRTRISNVAESNASNAIPNESVEDIETLV